MRSGLIFIDLLATSPAVAQDAATTAPPPDKKICRMITPTGSIMGKRFCLTKAEWQQLSAINERNADQGLNGRKMGVSALADH